MDALDLPGLNPFDQLSPETLATLDQEAQDAYAAGEIDLSALEAEESAETPEDEAAESEAMQEAEEESGLEQHEDAEGAEEESAEESAGIDFSRLEADVDACLEECTGKVSEIEALLAKIEELKPADADAKAVESALEDAQEGVDELETIGVEVRDALAAEDYNAAAEAKAQLNDAHERIEAAFMAAKEAAGPVAGLSGGVAAGSEAGKTSGAVGGAKPAGGSPPAARGGLVKDDALGVWAKRAIA
jgi:hypothetical protein